MLGRSFNYFRVDYSNSVFVGLQKSTSNHLDSVLNAAARMGRRKYDHLIPAIGMSCNGWMFQRKCYSSFVLQPTKLSAVQHLATSTQYAYPHWQTRLDYDSVLAIAVNFFSGRKTRKPNSESESAMNDLLISVRSRTSMFCFKSSLKTSL